MSGLLPTVVVVGSPNAGKSTLVNRLSGSRTTVVHETPGVTRDRKEVEVEWAGRRIAVVDTGGYDTSEESPFAAPIREQVEAAVQQADLVLFVVDGRAGAVADDHEIAAVLRRAGVPVVLIANKLDDPAQAPLPELYRLGLGEPVPVSAVHGLGIGDLLDDILEKLPRARSDRRGRRGRTHTGPRRHRRPPQRRQVLALQRDRGRAARHRERGGRHDAGRDRHGRRHPARPLPLHRYRRDAQGGEGQRRRVLRLHPQPAEPRPGPRGRGRRRRHRGPHRARPADRRGDHAPALRHGARGEQDAT